MAEKEKEPPQEEGSSKKKLIPIIAAAVGVILVIGITAGAYFLGMKNGGKNSADAQTEETVVEDTIAEKKHIEEPGIMVEIDDFLINLLDQDSNRYLKVAMTLEVDADTTAEEVSTRMAQIRDSILLMTGNKLFNELRDLQGKMQLREELLAHLNSQLKNGVIKHIYFTNFVIQ